MMINRKTTAILHVTGDGNQQKSGQKSKHRNRPDQIWRQFLRQFPRQFLLMTGLLVLLSWAVPAAGEAEADGTRAGGLAQLQLFYSNDVRGELEPCG